MLIKFRTSYLEKLFEGKPVPGKPKYSGAVISKFREAVLMLKFADSIRELKKFKGLNFEALKGDFKGLYSVRVNVLYQLIRSIEKDKSVVVSEILIIEDLSKQYE